MQSMRGGSCSGIEQAVILRHAITTTPHGGRAFRRHELIETVDIDIVVADVVITRIIEPRVDHLPCRLVT